MESLLLSVRYYIIMYYYEYMMYYQPEAAKALSALTCRALPVPYGTVSLHSIATSSRAFQLSPTTASLVEVVLFYSLEKLRRSSEDELTLNLSCYQQSQVA